MSLEVFNPRNHQEDVLTAFTRFTRKFGYVYDGENRTIPSTANTDALISEWKNKDKARLFLSRAVSDEFLDDFEAAIADDERMNITFTDLVAKMTTRYTPNTNKVRNHYMFHRLQQNPSDSFDDYVHRVKSSAAQCDFKCTSVTCTVPNTLIRDQIITGTSNSHIRDEALKKQWDLDNLIEEGRIIESGAIAASELGKDKKYVDINRTKQQKKDKSKSDKSKSDKSNSDNTDISKGSGFICFRCESKSCEGLNKCKYRNKQCPTCKKFGHAKNSRLCKGLSTQPKKKSKKSKKATNRTEVTSSSEECSSEESDSDEDDSKVNSVRLKVLTIKVEDDSNNSVDFTDAESPSDLGGRKIVDISRLHTRYRTAQKIGGRRQKPRSCRRKVDFHTVVKVNDQEVNVLVDTGADVNVMGKTTAEKLGIKYDKSKIKLRPYGSKPLRVHGVYNGPISFGDSESNQKYTL